MSFFRLSELKTSLAVEILAGFTTFSTLAYIIILNPQVLSQTGMNFGACTVATILASAFTCLLGGLLSNYPFAFAPGLGLNAYFTYSVVLGEGYPWQMALGISFIAGLFLFILTFLNVLPLIISVIPSSLRVATTVGIGFFLSFIGLKNSHIIVAHPFTLVSFGQIYQPEVYLTFFGLFITVLFLVWQWKGAILLGIIINWITGFFLGVIPWKGIISWPPSLEPTFWHFEWSGLLNINVIPLVLSFIFIAIFDTAGTLLALAGQANLLNKKGELLHAKKILYADAIGTMTGACLGTSPLTTYLESASGIAVGGRTGLTAIFVALFFFLSLFFIPLATSIPFFATSPALIIIGSFMVAEIKNMDWEQPIESLPAFLTLITIPLTFSVATGLSLGFILYPLLKLFTGKGSEVHWLIWVIALLFTLKFAYF